MESFPSIRPSSVFLALILLTSITESQHLPGYHKNQPAETQFHKFLSRRYDYEATTSGKELKNTVGFLIVSMNDETDSNESQKSFTGPSTPRMEEIVDLSEQEGDQSDKDMDKIQVDNESEDALNKTAINFNLHYMIGGYIRREIWAIPLISTVFLNLFLIVFFEVYVLCQSRRRNPLFLGQFLLFGLFLCSGFSLVFVINPSYVNCFLGTIGISVSYALIFSVLMVKAVFLISLDSGNNLPQAYQASLLFFSVLVQVAISSQSVILFPPELDPFSVNYSRSLWTECGVGFYQTIWPMTLYNIWLIFIVGVLAIKIREIRENYGEATFIGFAVLVTVPLWACWILASFVLHGRQQDASVAFGCQAQCLSTFLIIFMPKGRQLAAMTNEGKLLSDNQTDEYSPSFLHYKPYKKRTLLDPVTDSYTTLEPLPTVSAINPNVYFYRADIHPGMIY